MIENIEDRIPSYVEPVYICSFCHSVVKLGLPVDEWGYFTLLNSNGTKHRCYGLTTRQLAQRLLKNESHAIDHMIKQDTEIVIPNRSGENR